MALTGSNVSHRGPLMQVVQFNARDELSAIDLRQDTDEMNLVELNNILG